MGLGAIKGAFCLLLFVNKFADFAKIAVFLAMVVFFQGCAPGFESAVGTSVVNTPEIISGPGSQVENPPNQPAPLLGLTDGPVQLVPAKRKIRLLSSNELKNSVYDLTGIHLSAGFHYRDSTAGFDTGANSVLDPSIYRILMIEIEKVAKHFVAGPMKSKYICSFIGAPVLNLSDFFNTPGCPTDFIRQFSFLAYRGVVNESDIEDLRQFYIRAASVHSKVESLELVVTRILLSPKFLYRTELGSLTSTNTVILTDLEKASLIAYGLTGAGPDKALIEDALQAKLTGATLKEHVMRLLYSARGKTQLIRFFKSWLRLESLNEMTDSPGRFPKISDPQVALALRQEFPAYVDSVVFSGSGRLDDLFLANHTMVNESTAPLYGVMVNSENFVKIATDAKQRRGILTLASVMAVHSSEAEGFRDSPTARGLLIKNQILCEDIGIPSGLDTTTAIQSIINLYPDFNTLTVRRQFELMMNQGQSCISCHSQFMSFGYLFGNFDALGRFTKAQNGRPIDTFVNDLQGGQELATTYGDITELIPDLVRDPRFSNCFSKNLIRHGVGIRDGDDVGSMAQILSYYLRMNSMHIPNAIAELYSSGLLFERAKEDL